METVTELFKELLFLFITVLLPVIVKYGIKYVNQYIEKNTEEKYLNLVKSASTTVEDVVVEVMQTFVDSIKNNPEETFSTENAISAYNKARNTALKLISEEAKEAVNVLHNDFDVWLKVTIEKAVRDNKTNDK